MLGAGDRAPRALEEWWRDAAAALVFFKASCPICQLAFPFLERIAGGSLRFAAISQDNAALTGAFKAKFGITFPSLIDDAAGRYPLSNAFGISTVPSIFVVEPDGVISKSFTGFSKQDFEELGLRAGSPPFRPGDNVPAWKAG